MYSYKVDLLTAPNTSGGESFAINRQGSVAGIAYGPTSHEGVVWRPPSPPRLYPDPQGLTLYGLNDAGLAAGVRATNNSPTQRAIVAVPWAPASWGIVDLTPWVSEGALATDINNAWLVCGSNFWNEQHKAFVFNLFSRTATFLQPLSGDVHVGAGALNEAGDVVGISSDSNFHSRGYCYQQGAYIDLGPAAFIDDVNDKGQVVGSIGQKYPQNFSPRIWDYSSGVVQHTDIAVPPGFLGGHAEGINNDGLVVGTCWTANSYNGRQSAYIYGNGVSTDLNTQIDPKSGWHLEFAEAINAEGQITGSGYRNGRQYREAFLLTPLHTRFRPDRPGRLITPKLADIMVYLFGGVAVDGGGLGITPGGKVGPVPPWNPLLAQMAVPKQEALLALMIDELAEALPDEAQRRIIKQAALRSARQLMDDLIDDEQMQIDMADYQPVSLQAIGHQDGKSAAKSGRLRRKE